MASLKIACIQMCGSIDIDRNIETARQLITEAADQGAKFIATPEMTNIVDLRPGMARPKIVVETEDRALKAFQALAEEKKIWLVIGSLAVALEDDARLANRSFLITPAGEITARYDKAHMFDVEVGDGQSYRESRSYKPGETAMLAETNIGAVGLTICYDLRFAALYRQLAEAGAEIITCPAAFTKVTGAAHWHTLLRARAIETGSFLIAPAQVGQHEDGRETYGHSLVVSPWGEIIAERTEDTPGILIAEIDLAEVSKARSRIPSLKHGRALKLETR